MKVLLVTSDDDGYKTRIFDSLDAMMAHLCGVSWVDRTGKGEEYQGRSADHPVRPRHNFVARRVDVETVATAAYVVDG